MDFLQVEGRFGCSSPSYYLDTARPLAPFPALEGDQKADFCVIGGGFTGLSTALHLARKGGNVVLVEAHQVGWGASGRNGGQVGSGQRVSQVTLEKIMGEHDARLLWDLAEDAKALVRALITEHGIECDYQSGILYADHRIRHLKHTMATVRHLRDVYGYDKVHYVDGGEIRQMLGTSVYHGGMLDCGAAHLHPLNFARGLAQAAQAAGARLFEQTRITRLVPGSPVRLEAETGTLEAAQVVLACNGYLGTLHRGVAARVMPINSYMVATEPLGAARARTLIRDNVAVADSRFVINYFRRSADHRLLFGGGEVYGYAFPKDIRAFVRPILEGIFPSLKGVDLAYGWGGTLGITRSRLPHVARVAPGVISASGYSGHGVALATLMGRIIAEALEGRGASFDLLSRLPTPPFPGGTRFRAPLLALAMTWYALRDRL